MNAFTDEQLQGLKKNYPLIDIYGRWIVNLETMKALVNRLECAEAVAYAVENGWSDDNMEIKLDEWRKSWGEK